FFFQAEDGIRDRNVTGVQTCALPISPRRRLRYNPPRSDAEPLTLRPLAPATPFPRSREPHAQSVVVQCRRRGGGLQRGLPGGRRSEERRVGKECRARGGGDDGRKRAE